ncbi:MAG: endolytic transglycosylase MltG [Bacteroidetes bacterium]|nr:endolytic transglycosylase MltG [Bacteroidota bacterium]
MKKRKIFAVFLVVFTVLLTTFSFYGYQIVRTPNILVDKNDRILLIPEGSDFSGVRDTLFKYNYVQDMVSFSFIAKLMGYDVSVKPGRYRLNKNMSNVAAIRLLRAGIQEPTYITFNIVRLKEDLATRITQNIEMTPVDFLFTLDRYGKENKKGFDENTVLCQFIPNTYEVYWNISPDALIRRMEEEYERFWNETRTGKAAALDLTPVEVSILASIVQAEARNIDEGPVISGLYLNRLRKNMYLQADPTLVYASGDFTLKRVLNVHRQIDSPYNTYKYKGLPPGPINLPEIWAIDAVLDYQQHNYIYMCAKEDFSGYHNFATNLRDHNRNAERYQRALTIEQRKARQSSN